VQEEMATRTSPAKQAIGLRQVRRRLSVLSDNKLVEGLSALGIKGEDKVKAGGPTQTSSVTGYWGYSKRGYAPYNLRKRNQDSILLEEHGPTESLLMGVFDGHGESGDLVSRYFADRLPRALYRNPLFLSDPLAAMVEELDKLEQLLLSGALGIQQVFPPDRF